MKLSIVMIIYNTEKHFIDEALKSITASTLRDYEICMVDDGSSIDYSDLAKHYGARLYKQKNAGMLAARLAGVNMATGDYIAFVDSDDTVSVNYHQPMLDAAECENADIVYNDWAFHTESSRYYCRTDSLASGNNVWEGDDILRAYLAQRGREHSYYVVWDKIYRTTLLKSVQKALLTGKCGQERTLFGEDAILNFYVWRDAKKFCSVHTGYYFYRQHAAQSVVVSNQAKLEGHILSMGRVFSDMEAGLPLTHPHIDELRQNLTAWKHLMARSHYSHAVANKFEALYPLIRETYGVEQLKKATFHDSSVYYRVALLPNNFTQIDQALHPLFDIKAGHISLRYQKNVPYVAKTVAALKNAGCPINNEKPSDSAGSVSMEIPKAKIRLRDKILHNDIVYAVGVVLFKKGSKLRALLKRIL